jgi:hypothetical protein
MRTTMGLAVGLAAFLAGCDGGARGQLDADVKRLESKCEALQRENETLRAQDAAQNSQMSSLKSENAALKRGWEAERSSSAQQIAQLQSELALAKQGATAAAATAAAAAPKAPIAAPPASTESGNTPPTPAPAPAPVAGQAPAAAPAGAATDPQTAAEAEQLVADLQARINALSPKVGQQRAKIGSLSSAKVDQQMIPPPNGGICTACTAYYHEGGVPMIYNFQHHHIGPAIKVGDYRTQRDKEAAIQAAREVLLPLAQELKSLQDELAAAKAKLAKIRAGQAGT